MKGRDLEALRKLVAEDPGDPAFYDLARALSGQKSTLKEAQFIVIRGINSNPSHLKARLLLAKIYYSQELVEFAVRELIELYRQSKDQSIKELIESFGAIGLEYIEAYSPIFDSSALIKLQNDKESESEVLAEIKIEQNFDDVLNEFDGSD